MSKSIEEAIHRLIIESAEKVPPEYLKNDLIPLTLLIDVMVTEHKTLSQETMATMVGIAAFMLRKLNIPAARFADEHGNKLWSLDQVAGFLGTSPESLEEDAKKVAVKPQSIHPLQ